MPRQRTKHTQIPSERVRKSTFKRRLDSLFKKANELSILCGIEIVIIIHNPDEGHSTLWPSQDKVMNGVMKFLTIPERERLKKMVLQEKFLTDKVQDMAEKLLKIQKKNEETEMGFLMNQLIDGKTFDELDIRQLIGLDQFVDEKLKKLQNRNDELDEVQDPLSMTEISRHWHPSFQMAKAKIARKGKKSGAFATTSIATLMEDMREDKGFSDTMSGIQNNLGLLKGIDIVPESTEVTRSFIEGNQGEVLDDFGRVWHTIFSP